MAMLGLSTLPQKITWPQIRDRHLVRLAAGASERGSGDLGNKAKLAAFMLKRKFGLRVPDGATAGAAAAALVCKELGFGELADYKSLQAAVLGRLIDPPQSLPPADAVEQFIRSQFGLRRGQLSELRQALIAAWVHANSGESVAASAPSPSPRRMAMGSLAAI